MKISVLGLGSMGSALAACLINNGHHVCVWNRSAEKAAPLLAMGADVAGTAKEAVAASELIVVCIKGHNETLDLLTSLQSNLTGKTICECSTGDTADAEDLLAFLKAQGADYLIGMINAYPSGVGEENTTILSVASDEAWSRYGEIVRQMGGKSACIGTEPAALAALFAGLFTVRQGFMFGMLYGAQACRKAGVSMEVFSQQIPASLKLIHDYHEVFCKTVPGEDFDNPEASLKVYALAMQDALKTYESLDAPAGFTRMMHDQLMSAMENGLGDKQLTALVNHIH